MYHHLDDAQHPAHTPERHRVAHDVTGAGQHTQSSSPTSHGLRAVTEELWMRALLLPAAVAGVRAGAGATPSLRSGVRLPCTWRTLGATALAGATVVGGRT